jgi:hypothetical protein
MIDAEQGEHRGVQVVHFDDVFHCAVTELVRRTMGQPTLCPRRPSRWKNRRCDGRDPTRPDSSGCDRIAAPDDERIVQHTRCARSRMSAALPGRPPAP